jgi:hypothetical protein
MQLFLLLVLTLVAPWALSAQERASLGDEEVVVEKINQLDLTAIEPSVGGPCLSSENRYNLRKEFRRLQMLKNQGKNIRLIVGRGFEEKHPPLPQVDDVVWVFVDPTPPTYYGDHDPIQLVMDFEYPNDLRHIPDEMFQEIIFDRSVWKLFSNQASTLYRYLRLLVPGGSVFIDHTEWSATGGMMIFHDSPDMDVMYERNFGLLDSISIHRKFMIHATVHQSSDMQSALKDHPLKKKYEKMKEDIHLKMVSDTIQRGKKLGYQAVIYHERGQYPIENRNVPSQTSFFEFRKSE